MLFCALNVFIVVLVGLSSAKDVTLPVTTCKRDSADYSACLKHAMEEAWPRIVKGLPEFNFPPLDPMFYKSGKTAFDAGDIHAKVVASNTTAIGLLNANFNDVKAHFFDDNFRLEVDTHLPTLIIKGILLMNGTLSVFRIANEGPFNLTSEDITATWDFSGRVVNDKWIVERSHVLPTFRKVKVYFDFFHDNIPLNDLVVGFFNEYWPPLFRVMLPVAADAWDPWLTDLVNRLFSKVSFSNVFP